MFRQAAEKQRLRQAAQEAEAAKAAQEAKVVQDAKEAQEAAKKAEELRKRDEEESQNPELKRSRLEKEYLERREAYEKYEQEQNALLQSGLENLSGLYNLRDKLAGEIDFSNINTHHKYASMKQKDWKRYLENNKSQLDNTNSKIAAIEADIRRIQNPNSFKSSKQYENLQSAARNIEKHKEEALFKEQEEGLRAQEEDLRGEAERQDREELSRNSYGKNLKSYQDKLRENLANQRRQENSFEPNRGGLVQQ